MTRAEGPDRSLSEFISRNAYKEAQSQPALVHRSYHTYPYILRTTRRLCSYRMYVQGGRIMGRVVTPTRSRASNVSIS